QVGYWCRGLRLQADAREVFTIVDKIGWKIGRRRRLPARPARVGHWGAGYPRPSQVLGAARGGVLPDFVAIVIKHDALIGRRRVPDVAGKLAFELPRRPAGVAEGDEALCWPLVPCDVFQDFAAWRRREAGVDDARIRAAIIRAMNDETDFRLDRTAEEDR